MLNSLKSYLSTELTRGSATVFLFRILGVILFFAINIYISKKFGAAALGDYTFFLLLINVIPMIGILGLDQYVLQHFPGLFKSGEKNSINKINNRIQNWLLYSLMIILVAGIIVNYTGLHFFDDHIIQWILIAIIGPKIIFRFRLEGIRASKNMAAYGFLGYTALPLIMFLALMLFRNQKSISIFFSYGIAIILSTVFAQYFWKNSISKLILQNTSVLELHFKKVLKNSIPLMLIVLLMFMNDWVDKLMIKLMINSEQLGYYTASFRLVQFLALPLISINAIAAPRIAHLFNQDEKLLSKEVKSITALIIIASIPIAIVLLAMPDFFLNLFGSEFIVAKYCLYILLIAQIVNVFAGPVGIFLKMTQCQDVLFKIVLASFIINVILNLILIPSFGIEGAAISTAISILIINISSIIYIKFRFGFYSFLPNFNLNNSKI